jgi:hypothetical protein
MSESHNEYQVGDSIAYACFSVALHGGGAVMLLMTAAAHDAGTAGVVALLCGWAVLTVLAFNDLRRHGIWRGPGAVARICASTTSTGWRIGHCSGQWFGPAALTGGRVMSRVIWLRLREPSGRREVLCVTADCMSETMFRRLRVSAKQALGQ